MQLNIKRFKDGKDYTLGEFVLVDAFKNELLKGYTLEPAGADEIRANLDKRIPQGEYNATWEYSPKFKRYLPLLFNAKVSKDRRILIHFGNTGKDTSGCILLGFDNGGDRVLNSLKCFSEFKKIVGTDEFKVSIKTEIA